MISTAGAMEVGMVKVGTMSGRGFTPEEIAEQALDKIISIGNNSHPVIQAQAEAFRTEIRGVLVSYLRQAVASHNTTLTNRFRDAGHPELVKLLEV
mgnify:FL=1|jgi:hypothetical protein|tara:strand:- start:275 stop:562 length:288 start_codon:yes stop_codon:yes gene_type:complete